MPYKLLIADDDAQIRTMLGKTATSRGHQPIFASDGRMAVELALAEKPDGILLDLMMPQLDGRDVMSRLRADEATKRTPVLVLTAIDDELTRELCFDYGAADYVLKPFELAHVFNKIEFLIDQSRQQSA